MDTQLYPITVRDARKACRLRATCRRLRVTLGRRQGAPRDAKLLKSLAVLIIPSPRLGPKQRALLAAEVIRYSPGKGCYVSYWGVGGRWAMPGQPRC